MTTVSLLLTLAAFAQIGAAESAAPYPSKPATGEPTFQMARISSEHDVILSAEVEGVLTSLSVKEGTRLERGQVFATIDDRQAKAAVEVADKTYQAAVARAEDRIEEIFGQKSAEYARVDLQKDQLANEAVPNTVPDIQIKQKQLAVVRADLQTKKAQKDRLIAMKEADAKKAELDAARIALERRTLRAPFDGAVQQLVQKESQWVNPGDPILRLVKFDVLRVECIVSANEFDPIELAGRAVTVRVPLARGGSVEAPGKVVYVGQTVESNQHTYVVRAEIENQRNGDFWVIRPGMMAEITIHTSQPTIDVPAQSAARR